MLNRLYAITCVPSVTSTNADNNLPARFEEVEQFALALGGAAGLPTGGNAAGEMSKWVSEIAKDLQAHRGKSAVVAGEHQPPSVHAVAHALNAALGNVGQTVRYIDPPDGYAGTSRSSIEALTRDLAAGQVEALIIIGGNPVYTTTPELRLSELVRKAAFSLHLSAYEDETSNVCMWHAPMTHDLEAWGDAAAFDGTVSICQPMIEPLLGGRSALEVVRRFAGDQTPDLQYVRATHGAVGEAFDDKWETWLHDGLMPGTAAPPVSVTIQAFDLPASAPSTGKRMIFLPDPTILDGRYANLGWLQELPRPLTKLTWDNAFLINAKMADELGFFAYDPATGKKNMSAIGGRSGGSAFVPVIEVSAGGKKLKGPAWLMAGLPDDTIAVTLGYGRRGGGRVAEGAGFDANVFRTQGSPWTASGASTAETGETFEIACTQLHWSMEGRNFVREATLEEFSHEPDYVKHLETIHEEPESLYPDRPYEGNKWGMVIDTTMCTGCNACTVACQAENNIPAVGKNQVIAGREMHWIRIDRYYSDDLDHPNVHHLPVTCMHCELAPCETVCPVAATTHDAEGLNQMVYNRCIGTRYCSNNCPYKVRRFNFLLYTDNDTPITRLLQNPDVTVRGRGVMEKCTYCVQRINAARKTAKKENRPIRDGEIITACQQACPAKAITFGNLNDPESEVAKLAVQPHNYYLLKDLNTKPRTTYLGKVRNPNPALSAPKKEAAGAH
jgi:molybdopterin-containing oxidoreductase family iron-sulfur binding subunit